MKVRLYDAGPALRKLTLRSSSGYVFHFKETYRGQARITVKTPEGQLLLRTSLTKDETQKIPW